MPEQKSEVISAAKTMLAIVAVVLVVELVAKLLLVWLGFVRVPVEFTLIEAAVLAVAIALPVYWMVLLPIRREYERRVKAEGLAEDMSRLAVTDALTRIMNRRGITVALLDAMAQAERYSTPLSIAMADIDHFKQVNDQYGHEAGDRVLTDVASILSDALRMPDKVGRYGGEEFLIILPHTSAAQARKIAQRICNAVGKWKFDIGGQTISLTISLGLTQFHKGEDLEQLLSRADQALYDAKSAGRNRVILLKAS